MADLETVQAGSGRPIRLTFTDPAGVGYVAADVPSTGLVTRTCYRLRAIVGDGGMIISLDGGTTDHVTMPPNTSDEMGLQVSALADVRVRRYTAGTAFTAAVVEVR